MFFLQFQKFSKENIPFNSIYLYIIKKLKEILILQTNLCQVINYYNLMFSHIKYKL